MPGIITHLILAKLIKNFIRDPYLKSVIQWGKEYLQTGAVGPDLPYGGIADRDLFFTTDNSVANLIHNTRSNLVVLEGLHFIKKKNIPGKEKDALFCFLLGFICHITADGIIHPFINQKIGDSDNKGEHRKLEFKLDVIFLNNQRKPKLNAAAIHNGLMDIFLCQYNTAAFNLFCRLLKKIYDVKITPEKAAGWLKGLYKLCSAAEGRLPGIYKALLRSYLIPEYKDIKKDTEIICTSTIPSLKSNVHFINDCVPKFFKVTIPLINKAYDYIYLEGRELSRNDLPDINLDTGMNNYDNESDVPVFWRNNLYYNVT